MPLRLATLGHQFTEETYNTSSPLRVASKLYGDVQEAGGVESFISKLAPARNEIMADGFTNFFERDAGFLDRLTIVNMSNRLLTEFAQVGQVPDPLWLAGISIIPRSILGIDTVQLDNSLPKFYGIVGEDDSGTGIASGYAASAYVCLGYVGMLLWVSISMALISYSNFRIGRLSGNNLLALALSIPVLNIAAGPGFISCLTYLFRALPIFLLMDRLLLAFVSRERSQTAR